MDKARNDLEAGMYSKLEEDGTKKVIYKLVDMKWGKGGQ